MSKRSADDEPSALAKQQRLHEGMLVLAEEQEGEVPSSDSEDDVKMGDAARQAAAAAINKAIQEASAFELDELGNMSVTLVMMATQKGGLNQDFIASKITHLSRADELSTIDYLEKELDEVKGAALLRVSARLAAVLLAGGGKTAIMGLQFMQEDEAKQDPRFATRLKGLTVLRLSTISSGIDITNKLHLERFATDVLAGMAALLPLRVGDLIKDNVIEDKDYAKKFEDLRLELVNVETLTTIGVTLESKLHNFTTIVLRATGKEGLFDLELLPQWLLIPDTYKQTQTEAAVDAQAGEAAAGSAAKGKLVVDTTKGDTNGLREVKCMDKYSIAYAQYCPKCAHVFHPGVCAKYKKKADARRAAREKTAAAGDEKGGKRAKSYAQASSSASTSDRF